MSKSHSVADWMQLHGIGDGQDMHHLIGIARSLPVAAVPTSVTATMPTASEAWCLAARALAVKFPGLSAAIEKTRHRCDRVFDAPETEQPFTLDRGSGQAPLVSMSYRGNPADLLCVAHEFGHALQYVFAEGAFVPPVLRETAAFLAERTLLGVSRAEDPELFPSLADAWSADNAIYFGPDLEALVRALDIPTAAYTYRLNYPLARVLAEMLFDGPEHLSEAAFHGRLSLPHILRHSRRKGGTPTMNRLENYLPEAPEPDATYPALNEFRSFGMMAALDLDFWEGQSELPLSDYHSALKSHLHEKTALVAIGREQKPIGYATWRADDAGIAITRQAAPFGDHLELQRRLQHRLGTEPPATALHSRSAREVQKAW